MKIKNTIIDFLAVASVLRLLADMADMADMKNKREFTLDLGQFTR